MFTWWKQRQHIIPSDNRFRPLVEILETRELPAVAIGVGATVNVSQALGNQRQQCIVVNPVNTNQVVAFSNVDDITGDTTGDNGLFEAWSNDGGQTWNTQYLFTDPAFPEAAAVGAADAQAAWDRFGNLFVTYITDSGDVAVASSSDGGQFFSVQVLTTTADISRPTIAVGRGPRPALGSVWVAYSVASNTTTGVAAHLETQVAVVTAFGIYGPFKNPVFVPGSDAVRGTFADLAVGPKGQVMITYTSSSAATGASQIYVNTDPDGMGAAGWSNRRLVTSSNVGVGRVIPGSSNSTGIKPEPSLAWDNSTGPNRGRVYMAYADAANTTTNDINILVRYSSNNGITWSAPVRVNDDVGAGSQFNPAIAVDPTTGFVGLSWFDTRSNPGTNTQYQIYATVSDDGARTFAGNVLVSATTSQSSTSEAPVITGARALGVGDYNEIAFTGGVMQVVWADNSAALPGNPDPPHMEIATARVRAGRILRVRALLPPRWRVVDAANGIYLGRITIINTTGFNLQGPFKLTLTLPDSSLSFLAPPNTRVGNTVSITINANLSNRLPLRFVALLSNPLKLKLPTSLIGWATTVV